MKKIIFYFIILLPLWSSGQRPITSASTPKELEEQIDKQIVIPKDILCSSLLITFDKYNGSGFFLYDTSHIYFVTAKHVLFSRDGKYLPRKNGQIYFYPKNITTDIPEIIDIDLKVAFDSGFVQCDKIKDVAIIAVANINMRNAYDSIVDGVKKSLGGIGYFNFIKKNGKTIVSPISISNGTSNYSDISIGDDIYLFGYPTSISTLELNNIDRLRPLLRKGIIAGKYEKNKTIIIDSPSYQGNSGGPVFEKIQHVFYTYYMLIGIVNSYVPFYPTKGQDNNLNTGYSVITPIDVAIDLIKERFR